MDETRKTLGYMLNTTFRQKPGLFIIYFLMLVTTLVTKLQAIFLPKLLIDQVVEIIKNSSSKENIRLAVLYAAAIILLTLFMNLLHGICVHFKNLYKEWFDEYFEIELADHAMRMDFEHTENPDALNQISKAKEGISWYSGGVVGILDAFYTILTNTIVLFGVAAIIIMSCPLLLPVVLLSLAVMLFMNSKTNRLKVDVFKKLAKSNRVCNYVFYQLSDIAYGKEIRLYDSADMMESKSREFSNKRIDGWRILGKKQKWNSWCVDLANTVRDSCSYLYIGVLALKKKITIGDFSMYISSASTLYWSLASITSGLQDISKRCSYAYQFLKFLEYPNAMKNGNEPITEKRHEIEFRHVCFHYPETEKYVLRDINLRINPEEHLSVVGANGAGKTTFIKLLCRLYDVTEGQILVDGKDIREYSEEEYRSLFAVIFQDFKLFAFSLKDNIVAGGTLDNDRLEQALKLSALYEDAMRLENGVDTVLYKSFEEHGTELSGGQKQKTAISRALYKNSPIVILDEPTAALDPVAEYEIYRQFHQLVKGKTAIYISHRLSSCKFCDKIAVFAGDTIKEYGTHDELLKKENGIYAKMFAAQAQYYTENMS